ncbi:hypothetical protein BD626DRAFT_404200, partial [Schizophyllum amplum]
MLDRDAVFLNSPSHLPDDDIPAGPSISLCSECRNSLLAGKLPRFALANMLYRGHLPPDLLDITWIEEMVCSLYRTTAHVTRLFQSSDERAPRVFSGNTCAHDMNVISTASIMPRTPSDVNDMLSVIFVGPGRFCMSMLGQHNMFRIRKAKVLALLLHLQQHNRLYTSIPLDHTVLNLYPEDGTLPGLDDSILHD